jgi:hypothetical protein
LSGETFYNFKQLYSIRDSTSARQRKLRKVLETRKNAYKKGVKIRRCEVLIDTIKIQSERGDVTIDTELERN